MIYDYLPKFHQIEANNLKALQSGFVVSQMEIAVGATFNQKKFNVVGEEESVTKGKVANGHVVQISENGIIDVANATDPLFLVYNEPLNTIVDDAAFYATDTDEECLRLVQLIPGDEWMSDLDVLALTYPGQNHLTDRIKKVTSAQAMSKDDWYKVTKLADGTKADHFIFLK